MFLTRKTRCRSARTYFLPQEQLALISNYFWTVSHEDMRNAARADAYRLNRNTIYHVVNYGLWTTVGFRMPSAVWHVGGSVVLDTRPGALGSFFSQPVSLSILTPSMLKELTHSLPSGPHP